MYKAATSIPSGFQSLLMALVLGLAGCGGGGDDSSTSSLLPATPSATAPAVAAPAPVAPVAPPVQPPSPLVPAAPAPASVVPAPAASATASSAPAVPSAPPTAPAPVAPLPVVVIPPTVAPPPVVVIPVIPTPVDSPPVVVIPVIPAPVAPAPPDTFISGTAASGAAIANAAVTLKDSANRTVNQVTNAAGVFSLRTTGLAPPFMLQLTTPAGGKLYSVSADANSQGTINLTPITDLIVRSWYATQGVPVDSAFANPVTAPPPTPQQVGSISQTVFSLLGLGIATHAADLTRPEQLISKPFAADGTGTDKLLDNLRISSSTNGATMTVTAGVTSQVTSLSYNTTTTAISASTTATNGTATSTSVLTSVVPVSTAQTSAVDDINATIARLQNVINTRKTNLTVADITPLFDPDLLQGGQDRTRFATGIAKHFAGGQTVSLSVEQVRQLDVTMGVAAVVLRITETLDTLTSTQRHSFFLRKVAGVWLTSGDNRIADIDVKAEAFRGQGRNTGLNGPIINTGAEAVEGLVSSLTVVGPFGTLVSGTSTTSIEAGVRQSSFFAVTGVLTAPLPVAGTPITVILLKSAGGSVTYTVPLNAFTTELISITNVTGLTAGTAKPGTTVNVTWTLPTTYAVGEIKLAAVTFTGSQNQPSTLRCITDESLLAINATSAPLAIPATCAGLPVVSVNINLSTNGSNGERSIVIYSF